MWRGYLAVTSYGAGSKQVRSATDGSMPVTITT